MTQATEEATRTWTLGLTALASLLAALDVMAVSTALNAIQRDLGASLDQLQWTLNAYTLSFAVLQSTAAALGDRFGRRRLFASGLAVFVIASAACALAPNAGALIAARVIQGAGAAIILPLALALLSAAFPPERRGWALGVYSGVTALSAVIGPVVGGAIAQGFAWQWIFWLNVPIGLAILALSFGRIRESFGPPAALDIGGVLLATIAAFGLVWGLVRGGEAGWDSAEVLVSLAGGILLAIAFIAWELRAPAPMMPMRLFRLRAFSAGNASMFLLNASLLGAIFFMAQFMQVSLGGNPLEAGLRLLPWGVALALVAPWAGRIASWIGVRNVVVGGLILKAGGLAWIALLARPGLPYGEMIAPMIMAGAGFAAAIPLVQRSVVGAVAANDIGKASGALSTIRQLGGAFGVAIAVAMFSRAGNYATPQSFSDGFAAAIGVAAALSLMAAFVATGLPGPQGVALAPAKAKA